MYLVRPFENGNFDFSFFLSNRMDSSSSPRMKAASLSSNSDDNASGINNNNQYTYQMKASDYELGKAIGMNDGQSSKI